MTVPRSLDSVIAVDEIPFDGLRLEVVATEADRHALADSNGLPSIGSLRARLLLRPEGRSGVRVTGDLDADVVQTCVVTLEPVAARVHETLDVRFAPLGEVEALRAERAADPQRDEIDDEPDVIEADGIDVGRLVAEHFTLGLDPYPRKSGATLDPAFSEPDERESPFAVLRDRAKPSS